MRKEAINHLKANVPSVDGQVYQPFMAGPKRKDSFLVVKVGIETAAEISMAFDKVIEVWPYADPHNYITVDEIAEEVIAAFKNGIPTPAGDIALTYIGMGEDFYDPEFKKITNGPIEFEIALIRD